MAVTFRRDKRKFRIKLRLERIEFWSEISKETTKTCALALHYFEDVSQSISAGEVTHAPYLTFSCSSPADFEFSFLKVATSLLKPFTSFSNRIFWFLNETNYKEGKIKWKHCL